MWLFQLLKIVLIFLASQVATAQDTTQQSKKPSSVFTSFVAGYTQVTANDYKSSAVFSISPTFSIERQTWNIRVMGQFTHFNSGALSGYGELFGQRVIYNSRNRIVALDAEGGAGKYRGQVTGRYVSTGINTGNLQTWLRLYSGRAYDTVGYSVIGSDISRQFRHSFGKSIATASLLYARSRPFGNLLFTNTYESRYINLFGQIGLETDPAIKNFQVNGLWGITSARIPLYRNLSLLASVGKTSFDEERGLTSAKFVSLGISISSSNIAYSQTTTGRTYVKKAGDQQLLTIQLKNARSVEIKGDFTSWKAINMQLSSNDLWILPVSLRPGVYSTVIRIDQGAWHPPPDVPVTLDEFGSSNGLLVVK